MKKYQACEYVRLSCSNNNTNESNSITNQKRLIHDFLGNHPDIELVSEYVDDGYSGILFDRPAFQEMMEDVYNGKLNCIIVKDLSRFGREYIETGRYLRQILPQYGVRFISVTDGIDTEKESIGDNLMISMKSIFNDAYCRDISTKTRSALNIKRKDGEYVGSFAPYGYQKDPKDKNHLIPDAYAAKVVQDIYRWKIDGMNAVKIAEKLDHMGVQSPSAYKISHGIPCAKNGRTDNGWSFGTVLRILKDEIYTGTLVQGKKSTHSYKLKNMVNKPREDWIRIENTHEAIISQSDYDLVQQLIGLDIRISPGKEKVFLFSGILICGCCGEHMTRKTVPRGDKKYFYYYCPTGKKRGCMDAVMVREEALIKCVKESLKAQIKNVVSMDRIWNSIDKESVRNELIAQYQMQIVENEKQLVQIRNFKSTLYENLVNGILDKEEYMTLRSDYTHDIIRLENATKQLYKEIQTTADTTDDQLRWTEHFKKFVDMDDLDRHAVITLIQSITVMGKNKLDIKFRYQSKYEQYLPLLRKQEKKFCGNE